MTTRPLQFSSDPIAQQLTDDSNREKLLLPWPGALAVIRLALDLGAAECGGPLSPGERKLIRPAANQPPSPEGMLHSVQERLLAGEDPLADYIRALRTLDMRRQLGAFFTPLPVVRHMVRWCLTHGPTSVVDSGAGTGRFSAEALRHRPDLPVTAVEIDPLASLLCRAHLNVVAGATGTPKSRIRVIQGDYNSLQLGDPEGLRAFVGNPPYTRHHELTQRQKQWAAAAGRMLGLRVSLLSGLHVHFLLATALHSRPGDVGCFVTSAEWLDVNYGEALRKLLVGPLGLVGLTLLEAKGIAFEEAMTTGLIIYFLVGTDGPDIGVHQITSWEQLHNSATNRSVVPRKELARGRRWSLVLRGVHADSAAKGRMPLGTIVRVHRGVATGANDFFVLTRDEVSRRGLSQWVRPAATRAQEVQVANGVLRLSDQTRFLLDISPTLQLSGADSEALMEYLHEGERRGVLSRYLCRHRRPWWAIRAGPIAPMVVTYMARQAPTFALNPDGLICLNVVHGLYPILPHTDLGLTELVNCLNAYRESYKGHGRTYNGGLEKFEPRELEALLVPVPASIREKLGEWKLKRNARD